MKREFPTCYHGTRESLQTYIGSNGKAGHNGRDTSGGEYLPGNEGGSWGELICRTGRCQATEVERLRGMNCYDFMKLLEVGIKNKLL